MVKKKAAKKISRRKFISNLGGGLAGSYLAAIPLGATDEKKLKKKEKNGTVSLTVNGVQQTFQIKASTTLAELLRESLKLKGTKIACNHGECGACTVLLNGRPVYSCHILALDAGGREVTTIEGLPGGENLHMLQTAFIENDGLQCGFCTSGQIMSARALLVDEHFPTDQQINEAMSGNICRCGAYPNIHKSVKAASLKYKKAGW